MFDNIKIKFSPNQNDIYDKIKIKHINHNKTKTIEKPLFSTINCVKEENSKNYDCELIQYSLRVCIGENVLEKMFFRNLLKDK